jgi:hypothetical protein
LRYADAEGERANWGQEEALPVEKSTMSAKQARFQPSISYGDDALSLGLYPKIKAPSSKVTSAPRPRFVSTAEMKGLLRAKPKASLSHVWGLTVGTFSLAFPDLAKQWSKNDAGRWQFQGGDVELVVVNKIYIDKDLVGSDARLNSDLIGLIMTHELLHVQDNVDVLSKDGPTELTNDRIIRSLLIDAGKGEPGIVEEREYKHWVLDSTKDPDGNACTFLTSRMINAKTADRDSGPAYADYGNNISFLRQTGRQVKSSKRSPKR